MSLARCELRRIRIIPPANKKTPPGPGKGPMIPAPTIKTPPSESCATRMAG